MSKMQKSSSAPGTKPAPARQYHDRDLKAVNPLKQQFEPTDAQPIPQHKRMAGEA